MANPETTVRSRGADLFVTQSGDPHAPTLVLVHGYPDTHAVWDELAHALSQRFHVVAYDVRGMGRSTAPEHPDAFALPELAADLEAVIDATSPAWPVHLVGHDWGAFQCWEAVTDGRLAARIASFTAIAGPRLDTARTWIRRRLAPDPRAVAELAGQARRSWYIGMFMIPRLPESLIARGMERAWPRVLRRLEGVDSRPGHPASSLVSDARTGLALYRTNMRGRGARARAGRRHAPAPVPVQVIVAGRDRYISPALYDEAEQWATQVWRREIVAGHWLQRSHPREVAGYITELVEHVEAARASEPVST